MFEYKILGEVRWKTQNMFLKKVHAYLFHFRKRVQAYLIHFKTFFKRSAGLSVPSQNRVQAYMFRPEK
jgi:hypothetical protein